MESWGAIALVVMCTRNLMAGTTIATGRGKTKQLNVTGWTYVLFCTLTVERGRALNTCSSIHARFRITMQHSVTCIASITQVTVAFVTVIMLYTCSVQARIGKTVYNFVTGCAFVAFCTGATETVCFLIACTMLTWLREAMQYFVTRESTICRSAATLKLKIVSAYDFFACPSIVTRIVPAWQFFVTLWAGDARVAVTHIAIWGLLTGSLSAWHAVTMGH